MVPRPLHRLSGVLGFRSPIRKAQQPAIKRVQQTPYASNLSLTFAHSTHSVHSTHSHSLHTLLTLHTMHTLYTLHTLHTLHTLQSTYSAHSANSAHSTHSVHPTHSAHFLHSTHFAHSTHYCDTHSAHSTHSTHCAHSATLYTLHTLHCSVHNTLQYCNIVLQGYCDIYNFLQNKFWKIWEIFFFGFVKKTNFLLVLVKKLVVVVALN